MNSFIIYLLALGAFVVGTAEFVVSGVLDIIARDLQVSISLAGQLVTVYALSHALGAWALVMLTSKLQRKKYFCIPCLFLSWEISLHSSV